MFRARCGRCLKDVEETLELVIDRTVYAPDRMPSPEDGDDQEYMERLSDGRGGTAAQ